MMRWLRVLIDFPFSIYNRQARVALRVRQVPSVNVFTLCLPLHLRLLYGTDDFPVTFLRLAGPSWKNPAPLGDPLDEAQLRKLMAQPDAVPYLPGELPRFERLPATVSPASGPLPPEK